MGVAIAGRIALTLILYFPHVPAAVLVHECTAPFAAEYAEAEGSGLNPEIDPKFIIDPDLFFFMYLNAV